MMRVFKPQSAMSVGSWTLAAFSASSTAAVLPVRAIAVSGRVASSVLGCGMLTYTGVLIGATAIPAWHEHVRILPVHFAASGMASAVALLTLMGHDDPALNRIAIGAAAVETGIGAAIELNGSAATHPLRRGASGWVIRTGGVLSGPLPIICRAAGGSRWRRVASVPRRWFTADAYRLDPCRTRIGRGTRVAPRSHRTQRSVAVARVPIEANRSYPFRIRRQSP